MRLALCCAGLFCAGLFCAVPVLAAVDGTVTNVTTGKTQAGATVTLYKLGTNGLESVESVKSGADGKFVINQDLQGPRLIQTAYDGVTYNHMLPPGTPSTGVALKVYNSSKQPGGAKVTQHIVFFEPTGTQLSVAESYIWNNDGNTTYNDPDGGTLKFYVPAGVTGQVQINATAPQGMPIRRAADKTAVPNVYKLDFPIKPGETRIDVTYDMPFTGGEFESKMLYKGDAATRLVAPQGVEIKGANLNSLGQEPRTKATVYEVKGASFKVEIAGAGTLRAGAESQEGSESGGPSIDQIYPRVYGKLTWFLILAFGILAIGFALMYRAQAPAAAAADGASPKSEVKGEVRGKDADRRRR